MIGRPLRKGETVDHIDNDCTNDSYSNVQLLSHSDNAAKKTEAHRNRLATLSKTDEARKINSFGHSGELNAKSKLSNTQVALLRTRFKKEQDFDALMEEVPFNAKSLYYCLTGKTYPDAGGPIFVFAPRRKGRGKHKLKVLKIKD